MSSVHIVSTRVLRGPGWRDELWTADEQLRDEVREQAAARGLILERVEDVATEISKSGAWARLTCTATAHSPLVGSDDATDTEG